MSEKLSLGAILHKSHRESFDSAIAIAEKTAPRLGLTKLDKEGTSVLSFWFGEYSRLPDSQLPNLRRNITKPYKSLALDLVLLTRDESIREMVGMEWVKP